MTGEIVNGFHIDTGAQLFSRGHTAAHAMCDVLGVPLVRVTELRIRACGRGGPPWRVESNGDIPRQGVGEVHVSNHVHMW